MNTDVLRSARCQQAVVKVWLHSTSDASPPAALLLLQILPVFSVVAPCRRGASLVSVRRQTFTTGCYGFLVCRVSFYSNTRLRKSKGRSNGGGLGANRAVSRKFV